MSHYENITRIKAVYDALGPLKDKVVFVGGATISLYRERDWPEVRVTEDVDIVVEILQYGSYAALEEQLRNIGFANDQASGIICRFTYGQTTVDVMPTEGKVSWMPSTIGGIGMAVPVRILKTLCSYWNTDPQSGRNVRQLRWKSEFTSKTSLGNC